MFSSVIKLVLVKAAVAATWCCCVLVALALVINLIELMPALSYALERVL